MKLRLNALLLLGLSTCLCAETRISANYSLATETANAGGGHSVAASYTNDDSLGEFVDVVSTTSGGITLKDGFQGQIYNITGLELAAAPASVTERHTTQLSAIQVLDDNTRLRIAGTVTWSIVDGPLATIDAQGVVTAGNVAQDSAATVMGSFEGVSGTLNLTVLNLTDDLIKLGGTLFTVKEEAGVVHIPVIRTGSLAEQVTVKITTSSAGGTATAGTDYVSITDQTVTFAIGESEKDVLITILPGTGASEPNETFTVTLSSPAPGAVLASPSSATVRIVGAGDSKAPGAPVVLTPASNAVLGLTGATMVNVSGTAADDKGLGSVQVSLNGGSFVEAALTLTGNGTTASYALTVPPVNGPNTLLVKSIDTSGKTSPVVTRKFTVTRPLLVSLDGPTGSGTVTAGFSPVSYREAGKPVALTATPKAGSPGFVFNGWTANSTPGTGLTPAALELPKLSFVFQEGLALTASFIENPFVAPAGSYNGLVRPDTDQPVPSGTPSNNSTEGFLTASVLTTGAFSGKLTMDGAVLNLAGVFDNSGAARFGTTRARSMDWMRPGKPSLSVSLNLDLRKPPAGTEKISGLVKQLNRSALVAQSIIAADKAHYNGVSVVVPDAYLTVADAKKSNGMFTGFFASSSTQPPVLTAADYPQGEGYATVTMTKAGQATLAGVLADGTAVTASAALSKADYWPLFVPLYAKAGYLSSQVQMDPQKPASDMSAAGVRWMRPTMATQYYPYGWPEVVGLDFSGARYVVESGKSVLRGQGGGSLAGTDADGNASLVFSHGKLASPLTRKANISIADGVAKVPVADASFTLAITRATGLFTGTFLHGDGTRPTFKGLIYQKGAPAVGHGFFLTTTPKVLNYLGESGQAQLTGEP